MRFMEFMQKYLKGKRKSIKHVILLEVLTIAYKHHFITLVENMAKKNCSRFFLLWFF